MNDSDFGITLGPDTRPPELVTGSPEPGGRSARHGTASPRSSGRSARHGTPSLRPGAASSKPKVESPAPAELQLFRETVLDHYRHQGRDLPWRHTRDPYSILVSEVMLQQTQVVRVLPKYSQFLTAFPSLVFLAGASIAEVLTVWQGLGYNRRALALHRAAGRIVSEFQGAVPHSPAELVRLPGVGPATAAAVCVFAYDVPLVFIETNIRSAFIHFFFRECPSVADAAILPLIELTLDHNDPRRWYYALMDYGAWTKRHNANPSRRSRHHTVQSPFAGSHRQLRAFVLRLSLCANPGWLTPGDVGALVSSADPGFVADEVAIAAVLEELTVEGFLKKKEGRYRVA